MRTQIGTQITVEKKAGRGLSKNSVGIFFIEFEFVSECFLTEDFMDFVRSGKYCAKLLSVNIWMKS